ncbi:unnamed protein product, partial [Prorocentrum cordatum]
EPRRGPRPRPPAEAPRGARRARGSQPQGPAMGTTSDDTQGSDDSASFASLLNQIGKKHLHDIEDCNRRLAALQKENASLDKQLKALQRVRASLGATACEQDALPGAVEVSRGASPGSAGDTDEESAVEIATRLPSILRR